MKNYVINNAKIGQITNKTGTTELDYLYNMQNAPNRFLFYPQTPGGGGGSTTDSGSTSSSSTSSSTSTSTTTTTTTTTTTLGPYFNLTVTPGTNISEGDTVQICLNVNPNFTPNGTKIPFIFNINPL
jgi:predicted S18 family serine protease